MLERSHEGEGTMGCFSEEKEKQSMYCFHLLEPPSSGLYSYEGGKRLVRNKKRW